MKKLFYIFLVLIMLTTFTSCNINKKQIKTNESTRAVIINMPTDDTINGYRESDNKVSSKAPNIIKSDDVKISTADDNSTENSNETNNEFVGNKNSKVFHKSGCTATKHMSDKNKISTNNKSELINYGYKPCKKCNP